MFASTMSQFEQLHFRHRSEIHQVFSRFLHETKKKCCELQRIWPSISPEVGYSLVECKHFHTFVYLYKLAIISSTLSLRVNPMKYDCSCGIGRVESAETWNTLLQRPFVRIVQCIICMYVYIQLHGHIWHLQIGAIYKCAPALNSIQH